LNRGATNRPRRRRSAGEWRRQNEECRNGAFSRISDVSRLNPKTGVETADGAEGADKQQLGNEAGVKVRSQRHKSNPFNIREIREICGSYFGIRVKPGFFRHFCSLRT
jgi:hypothetical protein